jgi:hypothetical protein
MLRTVSTISQKHTCYIFEYVPLPLEVIIFRIHEDVHFAITTSSETCLCLANQLIDDASCKTNLLISQMLANIS